MSTYAELKKRVAAGESPTSQSNTQKSSYELLKERARKEKFDEDVKKVDSSYINRFLDAANRFTTTAEDNYNSLGWGNASPLYQTRRDNWNDLDYRSSVIQSWMEANKGNLDADTYSGLADYLTGLGSYGSSVVDSFSKAKDYYAQWNSEEDYNNYERYFYLANLDLDAQKKKAEELDKVAGASRPTNYFADAPQDSSSGYFDVAPETFQASQKTKEEAEADLAWKDYNLAKSLQYQIAGDKALSELSADVYTDVDKLAQAWLSPDIYNTIAQGSTERLRSAGYTDAEIEQLVDYRKRQINRSEYDEKVAKTEELANNGFWGAAGASAASVPQQLLSGAGYIDLALQKLQNAYSGNDRPLDYYTQAMGFYGQSNAARSTVTQNIEDNAKTELGGKIGSFLYNTGMSMADFISVSPLGGAGMALLGTGAATATAVDIRDRGGDDTQALLGGALAGAAEAVFENESLKSLFALSKPVAKETLRSGFKRVLTNIGKQGLEEGKEELFTTLANAMTDRMVMGDLSSYNTAIRDYMAQGLSEEEAERKATLDFIVQCATDTLAGFVSGGVMGGVSTAARGYANYSSYDAKDLVDEALEINPENAYAQGIKAKLDEGKRVGVGARYKLVQQNESAMRAQDTATIEAAVTKRLESLGESENVAAISKAIAKQASGETLTNEEKAVVQNSKYGQQVVDELNPANSKSGDYDTEWTRKIGTDKVNYEAYNADLLALADEVAGASKGIDIESVAPDTTHSTASQDGDAESAEVASVENVEQTKDKDIALIRSSLTDMGINAAGAEALMKNYDGTGGRAYGAGIALAYQYGKMNFPKSYLVQASLKPHQAELAYNLGRSDAKAEIYAPKVKRVVKGKQGTITYETAIDKTTLNNLQKESLNGIEALVAFTNLDVHVFMSDKNNGYTYTAPDGAEVSANGWYVPGTNEIWIDINAGDAFEGTMLYTFAHEITHYIKEWSPKKWRELADFLLEQYGDKNIPVSEMLQRQINKKEANPRNTLKGNALMEAAYEELVSDAMTEMLIDGNVAKKLAELKKKDKTLWEKIGEIIKSILERWGVISKEYANHRLDAREARVLHSMDDAFKKLQDMYTEAFVDAEANFAAAAEEVLQSNAKPVAEAEIITDGAVVVAEEGAKFSIKSMKADIAEGKMFDDLMQYCGWTQARVNELRNQLTALVAYMEPHSSILDMNETYGREGRKFSPYKPNSDPLYKISLDFSTLCSKRLLTQYVIEQLQLREDRPMTAEEQMAIRDMLIEYRKVEKGLQVACAMCYVEAARLKSPKQMQRWLNDPAPLLRDYFAKQNKEFNDSVKEAQADFKESKGYARNAPKKDMSNADRTALNKIGPKMREQYKPSAEEQKIIDKAKTLPNSTYLTAANLAKLSETDPEIYNAYTSFVRTATRSKSLETDEPYYYGDSTRDNGNGIIVSDSFIEAVNRENGMRYSSWSDWRIHHMLDFITAVIDNSVRGAAMHGYTKFAEEVRVLGKTGMMFNLSGVAGTQTGLNPDGSLNFSSTESIDINEAKELREEFPEVAGLQCIGVSDEHIFALLRSDIIDYVIPYHISGLNKALRRMADIHGWKDYTDTQHAAIDKSAKDNGNEHWHEEPVFSEFFVGYDTGMTGVEAMQASAKRYVEMCKERGLKPKFEKFVNEPGYWKLLVDRKMINQKTGELIQQKPVTPTFDFDAIKAVVDRYVENYDSGMEARALQHVVDNWDSLPARIRELKKGKKTKPQQALDTLYNEMIAAQPVEVKESARDGDYDIKLSARDEEAFKSYAKTINEVVTKAINNNGDIGESRNQKRISAVIPETAAMVAKASGGQINIADKYIAINGDDVWHEYRRHSNVSDEVSRDQIPLTKKRLVNAIKCIYKPDVVECLLAKNESGTVRSSFAYAKRTARGHYVVVEVVGGRRNPNIVPVQIVEVSQNKWNRWIGKGKTLGEMLYSGDPEFLAKLDVSFNKKNRVTATQFASEEAIANTSRSPLFDTTVTQPKDGVKEKFSDRDSDGRQLSAEQQEFFKDSKVRDADGNLMVMYHGSSADTKFTVFERRPLVNGKVYGDGFYFTEVKNEAYNWGSRNVYKVYVDLKNPYYVSSDGEAPAAIVAAAKEQYGKSYDQLSQDPSWWGSKLSREEYIEKNSRMWRNADIALISAVDASNIPTDSEAAYNEEIARRKTKLLKSLGYDGVIVETNRAKRNFQEVVAFDSNQIKSTSNVNPTTNHDIRYSDRDRNSATFNGKPFWSGSVSLLDGVIEEVHSYQEAEAADFHHSMYFSSPQVEKMANGENGFFFVDDGKVHGEWRDTVPKDIVKRIERQIVFSDRDIDSVSNRVILSNAFAEIATNDTERAKIAEYQQNIRKINELEDKLADIRKELGELSFSKGPRDQARIKALRDEATKTANRISNYDKILLRLEASAPLKAVLEREKKLAYSRASQKWRDRIDTARTGRSKTEMRHKVQKITKELNNLLLHGTKEKHVMIGLQKATADALSAVNMDTVNADERLAKIQAQIDKTTDPVKRAQLEQTYERIAEQGENIGARLTALRNAYEEIKDSKDPLVANAYQPEIEERIKNLRKLVGNTPLRNMTMEQLEYTYDTYKMVLTTIRNANKAFKNERGATIEELGTSAMQEIEAVGGKKNLVAKATKALGGFAWSGLKPVYAFKAIGSETLSELFDEVRAGEDTWAVDVSEAKDFYRQKAKQYHYDSWDLDKQYSFKSKTGKEFKLTLEQIMSLYAYSKRKQADEHLNKGGFVFDDAIEVVQKKRGIPVKYTVNTASAHNLSVETIAAICNTLTDEQVKFVDDMQEYLSATMGEKGNEVSLKMYGVKLFKEKFYFPLKSAKQYMYEQNEVAGEVKIKNSGFSKETVQHASNPVILSNFTDVWANHVNDMAMYHAFVLPLEDFNRVFNYKTPNTEDTDIHSVKSRLHDAYGGHAEQYIRNLLTDLNGGARSDPNAGIINKGIGMFKKAAVFASLSVVIQQPSAIARAGAYIDAKYFVGKPSNKAWDEVKKYAPIAIIKDMGYFDTNMGMSTVDFIKAKEYEGAKEKMKAVVTDSQFRDEVLSKAPAVADEMAWCQIWEAVKKEVSDKQGLSGEALLKAAGKRFTEVIVNTQVYDSVLSRSGLMRSKDTGMKMATAFMAEPTTSLNMITNAIIQAKRGDKKGAVKAIGSVAASMILNSILVSIVYAGRDDDEDKTYLEKYAGTLTSELIDSFNPLTLIPFVKDIVSIMQGYDVERSDMAIVTDLYKAWENLSSSKRTAYRKVEDFAGAVAAIFGLPVKNIMRDARGMYNTVMSAFKGERTTARGVGEALREAVTGKERSNAEQLYSAMLNNDTAQVKRVKARFKDDKEIAYAIRDGLVANDKRITQAAEARVAGNQSEYTRLAKAIVNEKHFTQDDVVRAINYVTDKLRKGDEETASGLSTPDTFKVVDYYNEAKSGDRTEADMVKREMIASLMAEGKTAEEAEKSFNNSFKNSAVKEAFNDGELTMNAAIAMLQNYGGFDKNTATADVQYWDFKNNYPDTYVEDSWFDKYYEDIAASGMNLKTYVDYRNKVKGVDGKDKKTKRMAIINSFPISDNQKDALYYSEGWSASTIREAPWH